ncbi:MAG: hypothetical protein ACP5NW_04125 [Candidatus Woesearchaeota archaeon]
METLIEGITKREYDFFDFDRHVLKLDKDTVKKSLKHKFGRRLFHKLLLKQSFEEFVEDEYETLNAYYSPIKTFFEEMNAQKYCNIKHIVKNDTLIWKGIEHKLDISGSGMETFNLNGLARFHMIKDTKITTIPVEKHEDEFYLILFGHPQIEIPTVGKIDVQYEFNTSLSLGEQYRSMIPSSPFVSNPMMIDYLHLGGIERYWYGKPGEVYFRHSDGFYWEIKKGVIGSESARLFMHDLDDKELENMVIQNKDDYFSNKREKFKMSGTVTFNRSNTFIYQGMLESSGAFPFFIWKNDDDSLRRKYGIKPAPSHELSVKD